MIPNFSAVLSGQTSYANLVSGIRPADLHDITNELLNTIATIIEGVNDADVVFVPRDEQLQDPGKSGWTLGHVIMHLTASLEEPAAVASTMARGIVPEGRSRYEVPWESVTTAQQVLARLVECRRMCNAFLDTWPDEPHLDITVTRIPQFGPTNAIGMYCLGLFHAAMHPDQLREIMRQAKQ